MGRGFILRSIYFDKTHQKPLAQPLTFLHKQGMKHEAKCANEECNSTVIFSRGYCGGCYHRLRRRGTLERKNVVNQHLCSIEGCGRSAFAKNLCSRHYQRLRHPLQNTWTSLRYKSPGQYPLDWDSSVEFFASVVGDRPGNGYQLRRIDPSKDWSVENFIWKPPVLPEGSEAKTDSAHYAWVWHIKNKYGLTLEDLTRMADEQDGLCAICPRVLGDDDPETGKAVRVCIDHNHDTNEVRGLLCDPCNKSLGMLDDDPVRCRTAADYLEGKRPCKKN